MPLSNGETFAGFRIVRMLGSGGMGEVYLAQHPRLPRRNALKVLKTDVSADAEYRARFNREADLASTLWHPHIVSVHDRGEYNSQLWISMDYVDGLDAARLLATRYPAGMPTDLLVRIVTAIASALDYAHKQGLLHRDVKPANIMLTHLDDDDDEQRILLADFGIARNVGDISGLTATNMTVGTLAYSAPEQLMGEEMDGRTDQYALKHHLRWRVPAHPVAVTGVGREVPGSHRRVEGTRQEPMLVGRSLGRAGQAVEPGGHVGVGQGAQRQRADPRRGDVVGDVAAVLGAGGLVDPGQVVDVVAGDGVAVVGGLPGAPDLKGLGRADPVDQLLEGDGFPVVVERRAGLLAVERIEHGGVAAAVLALTDPE